MAPTSEPKAHPLAAVRFEVKALVAYAGKKVEDGKVRRKGAIHHALVGPAEELWSQEIAAVGRRYDLSRIEHVHLGSDGEKWCQQAERDPPISKVTFHLDSFHVNRAVMSCFSDAKLAWSVIDALNDGDKQEALSLLEAAMDAGVAREKQTKAAIAYLKNNSDAIAKEGSSLGTMESENQHLYGVRMDSYPCAWSLRGASDMARIISRRESGTAIPKMSRECSQGERHRKRREREEMSFYAKQGLSADKVLESDGLGYLPLHQVDTRRMASGKAYALCESMAIMDRGI